MSLKPKQLQQMASIGPEPPAGKAKLVQSKLTSTFFFTQKNHKSGTESKYFSRPPLLANASIPNGSQNESGAFSQDPERHANLQTKSNLVPHSTTSSAPFTLVATETKALLPDLLKQVPRAPTTGILYAPKDLEPLTNFPHRCPRIPQAPIKVVNADTLDAALAVPPSKTDQKYVLVLNMANAEHGGGGWLKGALAQEEALCYRSSLSFTLKRRFYPMGNEEAIYSPSVVVFRESIARGHGLLDLTQPKNLQVVSVVSMAAIRDPDTITKSDGSKVYKVGKDRLLMKKKMRACLRVAGREAHRRLVLGALGCGAFGNPRGEVAKCWKEVLEETEFRGWFESVTFAVMEDGGERDGDGNFGVFWRGLDGLII